MVVAETVNAAKDGAEAIEIDYEVLPAVVETAAAARQDAPMCMSRRGPMSVSIPISAMPRQPRPPSPAPRR